MRNWKLPPTASIIAAWANQPLGCAGYPEKQVSKMWPYRFEARIPALEFMWPLESEVADITLERIGSSGMFRTGGLWVYWRG